MRKQIILSIFLLMTLIGNVVAIPLIIPLAGALISGAILGYYLGIQKKEDTNKIIEELESRLTNSYQINYINMKESMWFGLTTYKNEHLFTEDILQYLPNYAWSLAKYEYLDGKAHGLDHSEAIAEAQEKVFEYYDSLVKNLIAMHNETTIHLAYSIVEAIKNRVLATGCSHVVLTEDLGICLEGSNNEYVCYVDVEDPKNFTYEIHCEEVTVLGKTYAYKVMALAGITVYRIYKDDGKSNLTEENAFYSVPRFLSLLEKIDEQFNRVIDNLAAYFDAVETSGIEVNTTDLIDPYVLASQLSTDYETTGYYGYAASELALLGLPLIGLNKTVVIEVNGSTYEGYLFTNWNIVFEVNKTYTLPEGYLMFIVTDYGIYQIPPGTTFTIKAIRDRYGNELTNTTIIQYVNHSGDIANLEKELEYLVKLMEEYKEMQTLSGGSLLDVWNRLDDTTKICIAVIGVGLIYAITRKRR